MYAGNLQQSKGYSAVELFILMTQYHWFNFHPVYILIILDIFCFFLFFWIDFFFLLLDFTIHSFSTSYESILYLTICIYRFTRRGNIVRTVRAVFTYRKFGFNITCSSDLINLAISYWHTGTIVSTFNVYLYIALDLYVAILYDSVSFPFLL
jgi:hypothetical protein